MDIPVVVNPNSHRHPPSKFKMAWKIMMRYVFGAVLQFLFSCFYAIILYSFFFDTCLFYYIYFDNKTIPILMLIIGLFLGNSY